MVCVSRSAGQNLRLFLTTGILGGYTTFSFSLDAVLLLCNEGKY